jgi:hypothetical protein
MRTDPEDIRRVIDNPMIQRMRAITGKYSLAGIVRDYLKIAEIQAKGNSRSLGSAYPEPASRSRGPKRAPLGMTQAKWRRNFAEFHAA